MYYEEQVEEAQTEDLDNAQLSGNQKAVKCFELLLDTPYICEHFDVNAKDRLGATSLHYLARVQGQDSLNLFQRLVVEKGANFMLTDKEMNSVIHYAIKYKNVS
jgi:ankyrin repeat protein